MNDNRKEAVDIEAVQKLFSPGISPDPSRLIVEIIS